jgi:hypothetical protein
MVAVPPRGGRPARIGVVAITLRNVTFTSPDPSRLADFWSAALGYTERRERRGEILLGAPGRPFPRFAFQRGDPDWAVDDPLHLDLTAADMQAEVARLVELGAVRLWTIPVERSGTTTWTTMRDPDGNKFCVIQRPPDEEAFMPMMEQDAGRRSLT